MGKVWATMAIPVDLLAETLQPYNLHFRNYEVATSCNDSHVFVAARRAASNGFQNFHWQNRIDRACINQQPDDVHSCWATDSCFRDQETPHALQWIPGHVSNITARSCGSSPAYSIARFLPLVFDKHW